jgi:hypothetical protein
LQAREKTCGANPLRFSALAAVQNEIAMATLRRLAEYAPHSRGFSTLRQGQFFKNATLGGRIGAIMSFQDKNDFAIACNKSIFSYQAPPLPAAARHDYSARPTAEASLMIRARSLALALVLALLPLALPAQAETPAAACARGGTDDTPRPIPEALVPAVNAAFHTSLPAPVAVATTVFRCADGHVLVCIAGANLPCGQANASRIPPPGAIDWCRGHAESAVVPASAAGHDTIYDWRCHGGVPDIAGQALTVDAQGFIEQYWKRLP